MRDAKPTIALTLAAALAVSVGGALAQSGGDMPVIGPNVRITLTIVEGA